jgi:hypothetical protein
MVRQIFIGNKQATSHWDNETYHFFFNEMGLH